MSRTNKLHFIEAMLNWFASPSMGRELDVKFLSDTYDEITAPAWVSVEDELPKRMNENSRFSDTVLVYNKDGYKDTAYYDFQEKIWRWIPSVTHWMPLPTPPVKKGGEE